MPNSPYHFQLGSFKCIAIQVGGQMGSADFLFVNALEEDLAQALQTHQLEADQLSSSWTCLLVDTGEVTLLIDTGIGAENRTGGPMIEGLAAAGYPAETIDRVFLTHGHPDHIGGCMDSEGRPIFTGARYVMGRVEFEFWTAENTLAGLGDPMAGYVRKNLLPLRDQVQLVEGGDEVVPGVRALEAFGHTPGHLGLEIKSEGEMLLNLADSALHPLHLEHPAWCAQFDMDPDQTAATRRRLLAEASQDGVRALFYHFDFPSLGRVVQEDDSWRWQPLNGS